MMNTRRDLVQGLAVVVTGLAVLRGFGKRTSAGSAAPTQQGLGAPRVMRYEDGVAALCQSQGVDLNHLMLAHLGGLGHRVPEWLAVAASRGSLARPDDPQRLHAAVITFDEGRIEQALREAEPSSLGVAGLVSLSNVKRTSPEWLDIALTALIAPLALVGRGHLLATLHARSVERLGTGKASTLTADAALALAEAGDWDHALAILERARQAYPNMPGDFLHENFMWKYAYLHREVDRVMPVLAQMPFQTQFKHLAEGRPWRLTTYRIRAGQGGIEVPIIKDKQPYRYDEAAVMQIAALEDNPVAANYVRQLREVLRPRSLGIEHVNSGVKLELDVLQTAVAGAVATIAARRKDYAKAAALARTPSGNVMHDNAEIMIDAFLEEGDWRGAEGT